MLRGPAVTHAAAHCGPAVPQQLARPRALPVVYPWAVSLAQSEHPLLACNRIFTFFCTHQTHHGSVPGQSCNAGDQLCNRYGARSRGRIDAEAGFSPARHDLGNAAFAVLWANDVRSLYHHKPTRLQRQVLPVRTHQRYGKFVVNALQYQQLNPALVFSGTPRPGPTTTRNVTDTPQWTRPSRLRKL